MLVMTLEKVPPALRGELTRWLIEPYPGMFVGTVSAMVRDRLWCKCTLGAGDGGVVQIWTTNNEQGFEIRTYGSTRRRIKNYDGLQLVQIPRSPSEQQRDELEGGV
ncbi:MAG: type I-E CRISPR-associated endoribonuclease Cas2 [Chloroflexi bacterium]|nr:type I-E CRISPR-associated endoribonuclease Cas2 [Chloroflexota bacterium]